MQAHRIDATIQQGGALAVQGLPLPEGTRVEVIVLLKDEPLRSAYPLRGTVYRYEDPFEPAVHPSEWEAEP